MLAAQRRVATTSSATGIRTSRLNRTQLRAMGLFSGLASMFSKPGCQLAPKDPPSGTKYATFAGGCFWGLELAFQRVPGVVSTSSGYTGGQAANPSYEAVCMGITGHTEAVQVVYQPQEVTYEGLLDVFFERTDVTTLNRQGNDSGSQYRSGIFYHDDEQKAAALKKVEEVNRKLAAGEQVSSVKRYEGRKVVASVEPAGDYYTAEDYHQQYLAKGGRSGRGQSAAKGCTDPIRCYG